jgi:hypothetical protein
MSAALESLAALATQVVAGYQGKRRPSWAPVLVLEGELDTALRELGYLTPNDKSVARLWANFTDPRRGPVSCIGFQLCAGMTRSGVSRKRFFETYRSKNGSWGSGPKWIQPQDPESSAAKRFPTLVRATELGAQRVLQFAGHPHEEMRLGGTVTSTCCLCGRTIHDPISLERGIGPECWGNATPVRDLALREFRSVVTAMKELLG